MNNNDILRRLRYALNLSDAQSIKLFSRDPANQLEVSAQQWTSLLAKQEDEGFELCSDERLSAFLDGLIVEKRGLREPSTKATPPPLSDKRLTRNDILKKLRIALNFREQDMLETLALGGTQLSKSELSAFFRKPDHKHYRPCGNQLLRNFIVGLTSKLRD